MRDKEKLDRDRKALCNIHASVQNLSADEYNALIHAIWSIDRQLRELREIEVGAL
jgi:hypothetical protein